MLRAKPIIMFLIILTIVGFAVVYLYINFILNQPVTQENIIQSSEEVITYNYIRCNC